MTHADAIVMNKLKAAGNWSIAKGKLKRLYGEVLEDPVRTEEGESVERKGRSLKRTGKATDNLRKTLKEGRSHRN